MKAQWKDVTSYSRGDTVRVPQTYELTGAIAITVTRHIHYPADAWLVTCRAVNVDLVQLKSKDADAAKSEAIALVKRVLSGLTRAMARIES